MNSSIKDQAFPDENNYGISIRDYFAAKAMQGILTDPDITMGADKIAEWAYAQADAMLKAREE